jgi:hypothetical protein
MFDDVGAGRTSSISRQCGSKVIGKGEALLGLVLVVPMFFKGVGHTDHDCFVTNDNS